MATFLYRIGRLAFRRRRLVTLIWAALLAGVGVAAATAPGPAGNSFSIPGTEAQRAFDVLEERFPGTAADGATARVVFRAPDGEKITDPENKAAVLDVVGELADGGQVAGAPDPFRAKAVSKDGTTAYSQVSYEVNSFELTETSREELQAAAENGRELGLTVETGGDALQAVPETGSGEIIGVVVSAIVLAITFGSLIAAGMPLITALIGVGVGVGTITALGSVLDLSSTTSILATMIGLAVGIDYALFIVSRYRAELVDGRDPADAAGRAVGTAGSAVVFAGLTVVIALAGLSVVNIPLLTKMGLAAAGTVVVAVLVALTLIPAVLGFAGDRALGRRARKVRKAGTSAAEAGSGTPEGSAKPAAGAPAKPNMGTRWARFVLRRPAVVLLVGVAGLGALAVPATELSLGLPDDGSQPTSTTQRKAYDMLSEGFGPGFNGPLVIVVDADGSDDPKAAVERVTDRVSGLDGIATVTPAQFNKAGDTAMFSVVPASEPTGAETEELVADIRAESGDLRADTGARTLVTGTTAMNIDVSQKLNDALLPYLALVVGLAFLLLTVVFRSLLVPLKAALGFLLSVVAALGAVVAVFQWGWLGGLFGVEETGPIMSMMPIFMVGVVFGLAMDYEVFLVTRMREAHVHGESPHEAVVTGFRHGARVVTAAAVIMISVFAGFIGSSDSMIKMIGFGLAVAVLFDAFIVRMAIVPAVLGLLGKAAWWLPRPLDRLLPNVDVDGDGLQRELDLHESAASGPAGEAGDSGDANAGGVTNAGGDTNADGDANADGDGAGRRAGQASGAGRAG
ncbi:MMPL family transporter [Streptomyces sp. F63]|uniref:MMPL family transporter n=1 Tax=Streptomyces sp. F63 TaxID=2824887 RepID=UPI001B3732D6|nr:MMPL family transporter [Streptomyces sp. F63]MBQ0986384.1 MMPL family transporter [Streptomyces sp. F63]